MGEEHLPHDNETPRLTPGLAAYWGMCSSPPAVTDQHPLSRGRKERGENLLSKDPNKSLAKRGEKMFSSQNTNKMSKLSSQTKDPLH